MHRPSLILALITGGALSASVVMWQPGYRIVDGDTVRHGYSKWRLEGIDAPAPRRGGWGAARCPSEIIRGVRAKRRLFEELTSTGDVRLVPTGRRDPYGNPLARILVDGRDVGEILVAAGLAKPWNGRGPKPDWCGG